MVLKYKAENLYNADIKLAYLDEYDRKQETKDVVYHNFVRASKAERKFNKDVYEMTDEELGKLLRMARLSSAASVIAFYSQLNMYSLWVSHKYGIEYFPRFGARPFSSIAEEFVMKPLNSFFTQSDLFEYYERLENKVDSFILQAMFEGIAGERYVELRHLKIEHFIEEADEYFVNIPNEEGAFKRQLKISKFLYDLAFEANEVRIYKSPVSTKGAISQLIESPYIIKRYINKRTKEDAFIGLPVDAAYLQNSTMKACKDIFFPEKVTFSLIIRSGMMSYLYSIIKDKKPEPIKTPTGNKEAILVTREDLNALAERFDELRPDHRGDLRAPYSKLRMKLDKEFFEDNYCSIEFE